MFYQKLILPRIVLWPRSAISLNLRSRSITFSKYSSELQSERASSSAFRWMVLSRLFILCLQKMLMDSVCNCLLTLRVLATILILLQRKQAHTTMSEPLGCSLIVLSISHRNRILRKLIQFWKTLGHRKQVCFFESEQVYRYLQQFGFLHSPTLCYTIRPFSRIELDGQPLFISYDTIPQRMSSISPFEAAAASRTILSARRRKAARVMAREELVRKAQRVKGAMSAQRRCRTLKMKADRQNERFRLILSRQRLAIIQFFRCPSPLQKYHTNSNATSTRPAPVIPTSTSPASPLKAFRIESSTKVRLSKKVKVGCAEVKKSLKLKKVLKVNCSKKQRIKALIKMTERITS